MAFAPIVLACSTLAVSTKRRRVWESASQVEIVPIQMYALGTGLLLLTNDGDLCRHICTPFACTKEYVATVLCPILAHAGGRRCCVGRQHTHSTQVSGRVTAEQMSAMLSGIELRDGVALFDSASVDETREVVEMIVPPRQPKRKHNTEGDGNDQGVKPGSDGRDADRGRGAGEGEGAVQDRYGRSDAGAPGSSGAASPAETPREPPVRTVTRFMSDVRVRIRIGKNHIVRRLVAAAGLPCLELHRSMVWRCCEAAC